MKNAYQQITNKNARNFKQKRSKTPGFKKILTSKAFASKYSQDYPCNKEGEDSGRVESNHAPAPRLLDRGECYGNRRLGGKAG